MCLLLFLCLLFPLCFPFKRLLTRQLAHIWLLIEAVWSIDGDSQGPVNSSSSSVKQHAFHPSGITRLWKIQSVNFWGKYTRDWLSRQNWSFQHYCRSQSHSPNTCSRYGAAGAPNTQSPQRCSLVLGGKCGTDSVLQTKYVLCSWNPIEVPLKELPANSSMSTVAQTAERIWSLTRVHFLLRYLM